MNVYISVSDKVIEKLQQRELVLELLRFALEREFGVKLSDFEIAYGPHGKPYFKNSDICFNYSHCEYGAACVVAKQEVGVDIQNVTGTKTVRPAVIKRVCCDNEIRLLENSVRINQEFIKMWVQKEAYSKFTGKGFAEGFKNIDTTAFRENLVFKHGDLYIACYCEDSIVDCIATPLVLQSAGVSPP